MTIASGGFSDLSVVILLLSVSSVAAWHAARHRYNSQQLHAGLRALVRKESLPTALSFSLPEFNVLWRFVLALASHREQALEREQMLSDVMQNTTAVTKTMYETSRTADEICELIKLHAGHDLAAIAVLLRDRQTQEISVVSVHGISAQRINPVLLILFDALIHGNANARWGYRLAAKDDRLNFHAYNIGLTLTVPLRHNNEIIGGIWLGFKQNTTALSEERRNTVHAICQHAAASLAASQEVRIQTERTRKERDLLLGISHDLRAPGNTALYALRTLLTDQQELLSSTQQDYLHLIEQGIQDQLELLGDVLDYAKYHQGVLHVQRSPLSVAALIEPLIATYSCIAESQGLTIQLAAIPEVHVLAHSVHAKRILSNLLSNAVKYTPHGVISISIEIHNDSVAISVTDTGIGVPEDKQHLLGTQFAKFSADTTSGVGLGLAITKTLLEANGGLLRYEPNPSGGSIFSAIFERASVITASEIKRRYKTILVVDDDPAVCRTNSRYVRDAAQNVINAYSVSEAIEKALSQRPEIIITDYHLGGDTADNLISAVRECYPRTTFLIISGDARPSVANKENVHFLYKPVDRDVLCGAIAATASS